MADNADNDELMTIGRFAALSGLSIHALRHYDDVGLLVPADVDRCSGYRRYRHAQLGVARLIRQLRWIDLPIEEIQRVLADPGGPGTGEILARHRDRLARRHSQLTAQLFDVDTLRTRGITMPTPLSGCRPVQIKIAVDDLDTAIAFYTKAFGMRYDVTRRTDDRDFSSFVFGEYGQDGFFLLHLLPDPTYVDRPGPTTFGMSVDDLDVVHQRAIQAGYLRTT